MAHPQINYFSFYLKIGQVIGEPLNKFNYFRVNFLYTGILPALCESRGRRYWEL